MSDNEKRIPSRVVNKHETEANWKKAVKFIPKQAEHIIYDIDENYNYERLKIGDGVTPVNDLPFYEENIIIPSSHVIHGDGENEKPLYEIIEDKQDKLEFDIEPKDNSNNPITSGGVFNALKNITPSTGGGSGEGTSYTAGDLIEIKDGVIRSTLGDAKSNTENVEFINIESVNTVFIEEENMYYSDFTPTNLILPNEGDTVNVTISSESSGINHTFSNATFVRMDENTTLICGIVVNSNQPFEEIMSNPYSFTKADGSLPGFVLILMVDRENADNCAYQIISVTDNCTGLIVNASGIHTETTYVRLPENAIEAGNLIKIENGKISSTLGNAIQREGTADVTPGYWQLGEGSTEAIPSWYAWGYYSIYTSLSEGQTINVRVMDNNGNVIDLGQGTLYTDENADTILGMNETQTGLYCTINSTETNVLSALSNGSLPYLDPSKPYSFGIVFCINEDGTCISLNVASSENHNTIGLSITTPAMYTEYIKIPNNALNLDYYPSENSDNPITSGAVFNALKNTSANITLEGSVYQGSQNAVTGDGIYWAIQNAINDSWGESY